MFDISVHPAGLANTTRPAAAFHGCDRSRPRTGGIGGGRRAGTRKSEGAFDKPVREARQR